MLDFMNKRINILSRRAVSIVTRLWGSIPGRCREFFLATASRPALRPTQPPIQWVSRALSSRVKQQKHEADHSSPSSAEVTNVLSYTSTPQYIFMEWSLIKHRIYFHGDNFINNIRIPRYVYVSSTVYRLSNPSPSVEL
jgi:hypothetical protein